MWIKSSDTDLTDRRLLEAGPLGRDLYHRAQLFMAANLTNGKISRRAVRSLDDYAGIIEDGAAVNLEDLTARLVQLGLWRIDGDGYYDLRYEGLNPADLIDKRKEAGRASAAARAAKFGTSNPRANREHREQTPEQNVNRPRPRPRLDSLKENNQTTRPNNYSGQAGMSNEEMDRIAESLTLEDVLTDAEAEAVDDVATEDPDASLAEIVKDSDATFQANVVPSAPLFAGHPPAADAPGWLAADQPSAAVQADRVLRRTCAQTADALPLRPKPADSKPRLPRVLLKPSRPPSSAPTSCGWRRRFVPTP